MKRKNMRNKYEGLGFAEALIAIMVTGIAATVLMSISANSMRQLIQIEDMDRMNQLARSGAVTTQRIADRDMNILNEEDREFFKSENLIVGTCYPFSGDQIDVGSRNVGLRVNTHTDVFPEDYFRYICIQGGALGDGKIVVKIFTGLVKSAGAVTSGSDTKDYEYISIIDL